MPRQQSTSTAASTTIIATRQSEAVRADHAYRYWVGVASAVICGICFGIAPGIVSIYLPFYSRMKDCAAHTEQDVCLSAPNANCEWVDATCRFSDWRVVDCPAYNGNPRGCANPGSSSSSPATVFVAAPPLATTTIVAAATPSPPPPLPSISRPTWHAPIWIGDGALARHAHAAAAAEGVIGGGSATAAAAVDLTVTDETAAGISSSSSVCSYDYDTQTCAHVAGYDDTRTGIYAAASTALGAVVPLAVDAVRKRYGLPAAFATCAAVALLSNILATWSLATDAFMVMITARLIYGGIAYAIMGLSMSYVEITAPAATPAAGTALNFAVNLTYLLLDAYGVYAPKLSANYFWLLEGLHSFQWVITIAVVVFIPVVIGVLKRPPPPSGTPVEAAHAKDIELSTTEKSPFPQADGMMLMPPFPLFSPLDITSCSGEASAAPSGTTTAPTQSPADTPQPQHIACPPCLVVSPVAVGSPTHNNDGCSGKHVSFAAVPPQVIVLTAASSVAPSPTHPTPACENTHAAATCTESDADEELAAVSSGASSSSPPEPSQSAGVSVEGKMDSRSADCGTRDIVSTVAAAEFEIVEGSAPVEVETEAEATSFVEDLHALVTTYRMPFLRGILVASFENGCGIAAVTNFAPLLLQSSGFDPMQGNLLCGLAYVIGAALGAPIERRFSVRGRAFTGAFVMSASALVIGLSILPPVDFGLLTVVGLVAWIGALSAVYAPVYYYCSVKLFPPRCQATASATMLMASAFWTLVESAVFPSVVTALSGGDGGDKRWGRGLTFIAFAVLGTGLSALLVKTFKTWDEVVAEEKQKKHNVVASPAVVLLRRSSRDLDFTDIRFVVNTPLSHTPHSSGETRAQNAC